MSWAKGLLTLALLLGLLAVYAAPESAYISARHARNALAGAGPVMNPGERVLLSPAPLLIAADGLAFGLGEKRTQPPIIPLLVFVGVAVVALARLRLPIFLAPLWIATGPEGAGLLALGLLALSLPPTGAGLAAGLMTLIHPWAAVFGLLLGVQVGRQAYWPGALILPGIIWAGLAAWLDVRGLIWDVPLAVLPPLAALLVWQHPRALIGLLVAGAGLAWGMMLARPAPNLPAIPANIGLASVGYPAHDSRLALALPGPVYALDGYDHPDRRPLADNPAEIIIATAPEVLWLANLPEGIEALNYRPEGAIWRRGATIDAWQQPQAQALPFGPDLRLEGVALDRGHIEGGGTLRLRLDWARTSLHTPEHRLLMNLNLLDYQGASYGFAETSRPAQGWQAEKLSTYHALSINPQAPPGLYRVRLILDYEAGILGQHSIAQVKIPAPRQVTFDGPPLGVFSDGVQTASLMEAKVERKGEVMQLRLVWRAESSFLADYTVFVHLTRPDDPTPLAGGDAPPMQGRYPTRLWEAGEIIDSIHQLTIPPSDGDSVLRVGLFAPERGRLPLVGGGDALLIP